MNSSVGVELIQRHQRISMSLQNSCSVSVFIYEFGFSLSYDAASHQSPFLASLLNFLEKLIDSNILHVFMREAIFAMKSNFLSNESC